MADTSISPLFGGASTDQYLWKLRAHHVGIRLWNPDLALARDPSIFEKMLRDPVIRQGVEGRQRRAAGTTWSIQPPRRATDIEEKLAQVVEDGLSEIFCFQEARYVLATALFRGNRYAFIESKRQSRKLGEDTVKRRWRMPTSLADIDGRRVRYVPDPGIRSGEKLGAVPNPMATQQIAPMGIGFGPTVQVQSQDGTWINTPSNVPLIGVEFNAEEGRLRYGRGLAEALYHVFWLKVKFLEEYARYVEKWGSGVVVGKIGGKTRAELADRAQSQDTDSLVRALTDMIDKMRARNAVVMDEDDEIDVIFPGGGSSNVFNSGLTYFDNSITKLIDGALLPSGGGAKQGSLARGRVEEDTVEQISQLDRRIIDASLTKFAIGWFLRVNRPLIAAAGLLDARSPRFVTAQEKKSDPTVQVDKYVKIHAMGLPIVADDFYTKTETEKPGPDDELLTDLSRDLDPEFFEMKNAAAPAGGMQEEGGEGNQPGDQANKPEGGQTQQRRGGTTRTKGPGAKA